nr:cytochrome c [Yoonia sediminilitoris]
MDLDVVSRGTTVYQENCASCHGINLEGQPNWRSRDEDGLLPAPPHDASGHTWHHDGETLFQLTKYGVGALINDPDYASNMPIYDGVLSDDEIIAVLSYIKSTWPDEIRARHDEMENRK